MKEGRTGLLAVLISAVSSVLIALAVPLTSWIETTYHKEQCDIRVQLLEQQFERKLDKLRAEGPDETTGEYNRYRY